MRRFFSEHVGLDERRGDYFPPSTWVVGLPAREAANP
jgi:hypothetical protein